MKYSTQKTTKLEADRKLKLKQDVDKEKEAVNKDVTQTMYAEYESDIQERTKYLKRRKEDRKKLVMPEALLKEPFVLIQVNHPIIGRVQRFHLCINGSNNILQPSLLLDDAENTIIMMHETDWYTVTLNWPLTAWKFRNFCRFKQKLP